MKTAALLLVALIAALVLIRPLRVWLFETVFSANVDQGFADFGNIQRTGKPNDYLLLCQDEAAGTDAASADGPGPMLNMAPSAALDAAISALNSEGSTSIIAQSNTGSVDRVKLVVRTPLMRYPDIIDLAAYNREGQAACLAVYSRSIYGHSDLGANKARVERLIAALQAR